MGNDGGSIPTRRELVKEAARSLNTTEAKEKQKEALAHRWKECPLSHKPLVRPIVSDSAGNLYNKDALLQYLLPGEASSLDKEECHKFVQGRIKGLKDVVELQFELDPSQKTGAERWICPITTKVLGPSVKAAYFIPLRPSLRKRDLIPILPTTETEQSALTVRMEALGALGLTHSLKKASGSSRKRKADGIAKADPSTDLQVPEKKEPTSEGTSAIKTTAPITLQPGTSTGAAANGIKNSMTANLTAKVLQEEEARQKRRKMDKNENLKSLFSKGSTQHQRNTDFMTRGFSIPAAAKHQ